MNSLTRSAALLSLATSFVVAEDAPSARRAFGGIQPALSPNGKIIALSFHGCVARMPAEGGTLTRLTREPGWDIEPAWSPDGARIAYINSPNLMAGPLRMIQAEDGRAVPLPKNVSARGGLRFHPDGKRLLGMIGAEAYPSQLAWYHLETGELTAVKIESLEEPHDRRLRWALSSDGETILFTKNFDLPGEQFGNNGPRTEIWSVASAGGAPRLLATWLARVHGLCWETDGKGFLFVTDRGGALYDLWRAPLDRPLEGARKVTFGQADEDWPSLGADGRWLVHTDNSENATAIARIDLTSGQRETLRVGRIDFGEPTGRLRLELRDEKTGQALAARVSVTQANGKFHFPLGSLYRFSQNAGCFIARGAADLELPAGRCRIVVSHGPEYEVLHAETEIAAGQSGALTLNLKRWIDMPERGWFSGENHIHANYGLGAWHCDPVTVRDQCEAEDLHVANVVVANSDGDGVFDREFFLGQPDPLSSAKTILYWNEEFRNTIWGHLTLGGLSQLVEPVFTGFKDTTNPWDAPTNADVAEKTRAQGGFVSYTHPAMDVLDLYPSAYSAKGLPVDAALGRVDTLDVMGGGYEASLVLWYALLDCGFRIPAAAGTDVFLNRVVSGPPGWSRAYVKLANGLNYADWMRGQRAGRSFVTSGPMLEMTVQGLGPGETLKLDAPGQVKIAARARWREPLAALEIVANGVVVHAEKPGADGREISLEREVSVERSGWVAVRCSGRNGSPSAHMNPVHIEVRDRPRESSEDAVFLLKWIDRLEGDLRKRNRLPGETLGHTQSQLDAARSLYRKMTR